MDRDSFMSSRDIETLIAEGQNLVIYDGHVLKLDKWLDRHPGGKLAILHMVGRDATDEINAYHIPQTISRMKPFRVGRVREPWVNFVPPIRGGTFRKLGEDKATSASDGSESDKDSVWSEETVVELGSSGLLLEKEATESCVRRSAVKVDSKTSSPVAVEQDDPLRTMTRLEYAESCEAKEIADGIRENPSLDMATQGAIAQDYRVLHKWVQDQGLYQCRYSEYGKDCVRFGVLFAIALWCLHMKWYLTSAMFLGFWWQQIMFVAHDAGHRGISGNFVIDTLIGAFIADFCCGLSIGWWKSSHNVHHLVTNMPEHDPDLQNVPLFSTTPTYFKSIRSTFYNGFKFPWDGAADFMATYQKWTYYPIMILARFNLYMLSWLHLVSPRAANLGSASWTRPVEILFMCGYWYVFGYLVLAKTCPDWPTRVGFVMVSHTATMLLHVQITLSHWGMPTSDLGPTESFAQRQIRTTMDIDCPEWLDFIHGGLQFQAVHHLFPRVPRHNLRLCSEKVKEFCKKTQMKYNCYGFIDGNKVMLNRLEEVSKMVEMLVLCQKDMVETGLSGLH